MPPKVYVLAVIVQFVCYVYGMNQTNQELSTTEREGRTLLIEVPIIGIVLMVAYKIANLVSIIIGSILEYKLATFAVIAKVSSWLYQNYLLVAIGTAALVGLCIITSRAENPGIEMDHRLNQAARLLDTGLLKYSRLIN